MSGIRSAIPHRVAFRWLIPSTHLEGKGKHHLINEGCLSVSESVGVFSSGLCLCIRCSYHVSLLPLWTIPQPRSGDGPYNRQHGTHRWCMRPEDRGGSWAIPHTTYQQRSFEDGLIAFGKEPQGTGERPAGGGGGAPQKRP